MKIQHTTNSATPSTDEDRRILNGMKNGDIHPFVSTSKSRYKWIDYFPLHYLLSIIFLFYSSIFLLKWNAEVSAILALPITIPALLVLIYKLKKIGEFAFEERLILPHKNSYTRVISDEIFFRRYKFFLRLFFTILYFQVFLLVAIFY